MSRVNTSFIKTHLIVFPSKSFSSLSLSLSLILFNSLFNSVSLTLHDVETTQIAIILAYMALLDGMSHHKIISP